MNARTLAALLLKVWGITAIVSALISLGSYAAALPFSSSEARAVLLSNTAGFILSVVAGVVVLKFATAIATRLFEPSVDAPLVIPAEALLRVFLVTLGLYLCVEGLRNSAVIGFELALKPSWDRAGALETIWDRQREALVSAAVELVSGVAFLRFRRQLSDALATSISG
jgi:hypothetical protein